MAYLRSLVYWVHWIKTFDELPRHWFLVWQPTNERHRSSVISGISSKFSFLDHCSRIQKAFIGVETMWSLLHQSKTVSTRYTAKVFSVPLHCDWSCRVLFWRALDILRYMQTSEESSACVDVTINKLLDHNLSAKYAVTGRLSKSWLNTILSKWRREQSDSFIEHLSLVFRRYLFAYWDVNQWSRNVYFILFFSSRETRGCLWSSCAADNNDRIIIFTILLPLHWSSKQLPEFIAQSFKNLRCLTRHLCLTCVQLQTSRLRGEFWTGVKWN